MKKELQVKINRICIEQIDKFNNYLDSLTAEQIDSVKVKKFRNCNARVVIYDKYYLLISYNTRVALIDRATGEAYDFLRYVYGYTATSAMHINKFFKDYTWCKWYPETVYTYR